MGEADHHPRPQRGEVIVTMSLTMTSNLGVRKGDVLLVGRNRRYKVLEVVSHTEVRIRRTFGQWLKDLWAQLFWPPRRARTGSDPRPRGR